MQCSNSAQTSALISDERIRNVLREGIRRAIHIDRSHTRTELATASRVGVHHIDAIVTHDNAKQRRVASEDALSLAYVLGDEAVNALLGLMGYGHARRLDEPEEINPSQIVASALTDFAIIANAAADGRIDHVERPACQQAADHIIATVLPLSSAGRA